MTPEDNLTAFIADLETCQKELREVRSPGRARQIMSHWRQEWKQGGHSLPKLALPLAILAVDAVCHIYGESEEWVEKKVHIQEMDAVAQLLAQVREALKEKDTAERMWLLVIARQQLSKRVYSEAMAPIVAKRASPTGTVTAEEKLELARELLVAGLMQDSGGKHSRWYFGGLYGRLDLVRKVAEGLSADVQNMHPDFLCALRGSGLPLATALAYHLGLSLAWFLEPREERLIPGAQRTFIRNKRASVMMVDSHSVSGGTLLRHGLILKERLGAKVCKPLVIFDCDSLGEKNFRNMDCDAWFSNTFNGMTSLTKLSSVQPHLPSSQQGEPSWADLLRYIEEEGLEFWQPNLGDGNSSTPETAHPEAKKAHDGLKIHLLDNELARDCKSATAVRLTWKDAPANAIEPWRFYLNPQLLDRASEKMLQWIAGKRYSTIVAASYWGIPFALFLAHKIDAREVFCLDGEVMRAPLEEDLQGKEVLLVDDSVKRGTDINESFRTLDKMHAKCRHCLVFLDNDSYPSRSLEIPEGIEIRALTSASNIEA